VEEIEACPSLIRHHRSKRFPNEIARILETSAALPAALRLTACRLLGRRKRRICSRLGVTSHERARVFNRSSGEDKELGA
jgi:hypothetical protein